MNLDANKNYVVLARKYRPKDFSDLRGQDVLVQTISNAIKMNRLPHAFLLTGIRGVGKTTTARILAKTVNCKNLQIHENMVLPCNKCDSCISFQQDKNPDIIEVDAASKTGVTDIREIIENCRYMPQMSRYKIYVIDEVHMLSINAFNALLKTLEEPPQHVMFVFATTESRKIPITILSRCQRFDLRRLSHNEIVSHLTDITQKENVTFDQRALDIIAKCSEGSVRDSLSLLDQAIMYAQNNNISSAIVESILGIGDKTVTIDILEYVVTGQLQNALDLLKEVYFKGTDLQLLISDIMDLVNLVIKLQANITLDDYLYTEEDIQKIKTIASKIQSSYLILLWQVLSKSITELQNSFNILVAMEMVLIKACYILDDKNSYEELSSNSNVVEKKNIDNSKEKIEVAKNTPNMVQCETRKLDSYRDLVNLFYENKEMILYHHLYEDVNLVKFESRVLKIRPSKAVPNNFPNIINRFLDEWTGSKWVVSISGDDGELSLKEQDENKTKLEQEEIIESDIVKAALETFVGAKVTTVLKNENIN